MDWFACAASAWIRRALRPTGAAPPARSGRRAWPWPRPRPPCTERGAPRPGPACSLICFARSSACSRLSSRSLRSSSISPISSSRSSVVPVPTLSATRLYWSRRRSAEYAEASENNGPSTSEPAPVKVRTATSARSPRNWSSSASLPARRSSASAISTSSWLLSSIGDRRTARRACRPARAAGRARRRCARPRFAGLQRWQVPPARPSTARRPRWSMPGGWLGRDGSCGGPAVGVP